MIKKQQQKEINYHQQYYKSIFESWQLCVTYVSQCEISIINKTSFHSQARQVKSALRHGLQTKTKLDFPKTEQWNVTFYCYNIKAPPFPFTHAFNLKYLSEEVCPEKALDDIPFL